MLDSETKRRIDSARDILVGKVPDPKSQVEQITIALIYKFMDDMDAQAEELGGKRKFFVGEFAPYGWAKLMTPSISGEERIALYADGMVKMSQNPGVPALFRNIFKNAFLPYRDPETLKLFLKTINEFEYDHSERLGDAFEYLLSVLGSQGDAGQFRTPRHIIDFIVSIVDPKKNETVLDPACGTAGFLISAYKHILRANSTPVAIEKTAGNGEAAIHTSRIPAAKGDKLTPEERKKLADNFRGYDISPDMVRLSLVNMYLHGFKDPHVFEYDTLTSQDRWNEVADVILANPPFMSPKGGIKPHNRFSVQSKRSEVLFVDYVAEHLTPGGRAGIIVPEGIIFQSQTAYKALRKMLVEQYLVAVVSLPAGVFNPYSGVKTSILILDKSLAKQSDTVGFFKVENDGFNLGAQRRPIDRNDLPQVLAEVNEYLRRLRAKESVAAEYFTPTRGLIVPKEKIAANGDYNLSGERYREGAATTSAFPFIPVGEVFEKSDESVMPETLAGPVTYIGLENITQNTGKLDGLFITENPADIKSLKNVFKAGNILYGKLRPNLNKVWLADRDGICSTDIFVIRPSDDRAIPALYAHIFRSTRFNDAVMSELKGAQLPRVGWASFAAIEIPLPPLEVQKEIVAEIEGYQKVIDGARAVLDHYRPHIPIQPDWPMVKLGDFCEMQVGFACGKSEEGDDGIPHIRPMNITDAGLFTWEGVKRIHATEFAGNEDRTIRQGDVLFNNTNSAELVGKTCLIPEDINGGYSNHMTRLRPAEDKADATYLATALHSLWRTGYFGQLATRWIGQAGVNTKTLASVRIPLPPLEEQKKIVAEIEAERRLVESNRELIARMEAKIAATLARVWGEEPPTEPQRRNPTGTTRPKASKAIG
jgi:type I restriction enzyme M protein